MVTVKEKLDEENNSMQFSVQKSYIYPDNISKISADEICILYLNEEINFEKIYENLENSVEEQKYRKGGQKELDKEIIDMFFYNADYRWNHKSIIPYSRAIEKVMRDK